MKTLFSAALIFVFSFSFAQRPAGAGSGSGRPAPKAITGIVFDSLSAAPVAFATVSLYADSILFDAAITDEEGSFLIPLPKPGNYELVIQEISHYTLEVKITVEAGKALSVGRIAMIPSSTEIEGIEIRPELSSYEVSLDKKIFRVGEDLASTGGDATDVLEQIPAVTVDIDDNIQLRGSDQMRILINGRPSMMLGTDPAAALRQIPASMIERIEVITNPSARYDSEGMVGIINIVLRKQKQKGSGLMLSLGAGTNGTGNASVNANRYMGGLNIYGGYDIRRSRRVSDFSHDRYTFYPNDSSSRLLEESMNRRGGFSHTGRVGMDWELNKRNSLSVSGMLRTSQKDGFSMSSYTNHNHAGTEVGSAYREYHETEVEPSSEVTLNYKRSFSKPGRELTVDFSTGFERDADVEESGIVRSSGVIPTAAGLAQLAIDTTWRSNTTARIDYIHPVGEKWRFEFGAKTEQDVTDQVFQLFTGDPDSLHLNPTPVSDDRYKFNRLVSGAYAITGFKQGQYSIQVGLRAEQTTARGDLIKTAQNFDRSYFDLFPSAHVSKVFAKNHTVQASYSRRINRPSHWALNPFGRVSDPLNKRLGNPDLKPEYVQSFEIEHIKSWESATWSAAIFGRQSNNEMQRIRTLDTSGVSTVNWINLGTETAIGAEASFHKRFDRKAEFRLGANGDIGEVRYTLNGRDSVLDKSSWGANGSGSFTLAKNWRVQITGFYRAPFRVPTGRILGMAWTDIGVSRTLWNDRGRLSLRLSDPLNTRAFRVFTEGGDHLIETIYDSRSRHLHFSFSYRMNSYKAKRLRGGGDGGDMDEGGF